MKLPENFVNQMKEMLGNEYDAFEASYNLPYYRGLRVNTKKITVNDFLDLFPYTLRPIPWTSDGFYFTEDAVTKHPLFHAGLYYIQEPSAMAPVGQLDIHEKDVVLDLCAAPGGKTLQMAVKLSEEGLIVTNDISDKRVKAIIRNIEKFGIKNAIVLNEDQWGIGDKLPNVFDKILIDAPCSGEGMFRKDPKATEAYKSYDREECASIQSDILKAMPKLFHEGTEIVYSTCTFNTMENENQCSRFIADNETVHAKSIISDYFEVKGNTARIWPHKVHGEGHFLARFQIRDDQNQGVDLQNNASAFSERTSSVWQHNQANQPPEPLKDFMADNMVEPLKGHFRQIKDKVYLVPEYSFDLKGLKVAREGLLLGDIKKNRFIPAQSMALAIEPHAFKRQIDFDPDSTEAIKYLKCESLFVEDKVNGFYIVTTAGYSLGFCKIQNGQLKNLYPASWRLF